MSKSQKYDRLRRHLGRVLGSHNRWGRPAIELHRLRVYRTATSPTIAHLMEDDDVFEAYGAKLETGLIRRGRAAPQ